MVDVHRLEADVVCDESQAAVQPLEQFSGPLLDIVAAPFTAVEPVQLGQMTGSIRIRPARRRPRNLEDYGQAPPN
jgi:hypothetical protein